MNMNKKIQTMVTSALLCALGIVIPLFAPKIAIPPASFTLASHVPIYIAMFISPLVAAVVALVTTLGFFFSGLPIIIVLRALSHIVFVLIGAFMLKKMPNILQSPKTWISFSLLISFIHAFCEVAVVTWFFFNNSLSALNYQHGFGFSVLLLVGVGGMIHSMIDFCIALAVWKPVGKIVPFPVAAKA